MSPRGLEKGRTLRIRDAETIVISRRTWRESGTALPVLFEQRRDPFDGLPSVSTPFEREANEIHSNQTRFFFHVFPREHRLIPDRESVFVHTMLETPDPPGRVAHDPIGVCGLRNRDVGTLEFRAEGMILFEELNEGLAFSRLPIAVLAEEGLAALRMKPESHD